MDPMGREAWAELGIDADIRRSTVSVSATKTERHHHPYRPTVDGDSDDLVYIDLPAVLVTAHDCIKIHAYVREMRRARSKMA